LRSLGRGARFSALEAWVLGRPWRPEALASHTLSVYNSLLAGNGSFVLGLAL
jgi:hypothetical protein